MPRTARIKSEDSIYHIMIRSVGDTILFRNNEDKDTLLEILRHYKNIFLFKIYAYCLMDTHAHFLIDANGADVSKFMHSINQCYAQYYNKKYERRGHVFADRFKSIIVDNDAYLVTLSGYIHKNPTDIKNYKDNIENYPYSSLGIYLGLKKDTYGIVDSYFVLSQFSNDIKKARELYVRFIGKCNDKKMKAIVEFEHDGSAYRSERKILVRNLSPNAVLQFLANYCKSVTPDIFHIKGKKGAKEFRGVAILLMRSLCNISYKEICALAGNITISQASNLCSFGFNVIKSNKKYQSIIKDLINAANS
ncbi:MAG: transposase [Caloramator sp.]|nr:transposase [Caloramator sp.]